ncbi:hypothetical protein ACFQ0B_13770 [Nonomuraea thailandensis]
MPFVIEEVVRSLLDDEGRLPEPEALDRMGVPVLLREAMAERLTGLSPAALRAVHAAAVMGLPAEEPLINAIAGLPAPRPAAPGHTPRAAPGRQDQTPQDQTPQDEPGESGLSEALQAGVLREHPDGLYGFRHALARQAVYDAIPGPERRLTHRRAMAALAALDPPPLVQLAHHARRAGDFAAWQRHGSAAADHSAAIGDIPLAVELLEGLLSDPKLPRQARGPLALRLSRVAAIGLSHRRVVRILRHLLSDDFLSPGYAARPGSTSACCCPTRPARSPRAGRRSWPRSPTWPTAPPWQPAAWRCWRCPCGAASRWPCTRSG